MKPLKKKKILTTVTRKNVISKKGKETTSFYTKFFLAQRVESNSGAQNTESVATKAQARETAATCLESVSQANPSQGRLRRGQSQGSFCSARWFQGCRPLCNWPDSPQNRKPVSGGARRALSSLKDRKGDALPEILTL